ncbi:hypothetical protein ILYODFUR_021765, partial [Ilyodon furcidens]
TSHREEAQGTAQDTLEGLCLSAGLGTPLAPPEELEEVSGERDVLVSLLSLLPPQPASCRRGTQSTFADKVSLFLSLLLVLWLNEEGVERDAEVARNAV